jgi:hypothetical protein
MKLYLGRVLRQTFQWFYQILVTNTEIYKEWTYAENNTRLIIGDREQEIRSEYIYEKGIIYEHLYFL